MMSLNTSVVSKHKISSLIKIWPAEHMADFLLDMVANSDGEEWDALEKTFVQYCQIKNFFERI